MLVVWCPDWPVVAWGVPLDEPAAVVVANRVVACSPAARAEGVSIGIRRRDAQGRCPDIAILERDVDREGRLFEPVAIALEGITPQVEVAGPGLVGFPTRGPSRFFGGDEQLCEEVAGAVEPILAGRGACRIGVADGIFAARLAARAVRAESLAVVIPAGESVDFLAPLPVGELAVPELTDVLGRLGLRTIGAFADLVPADVIGRFGQVGQLAHRLARGEDQHPPDLRRPAPDMAVTWQFEPAALQIDRCAFAAKALADELHASLSGNGLACVRVAIEAETESGETHIRLWRHEGALSAAALAERARWQLDGWLHLARSARQHQEQENEPPDDVGVGAGIIRLSLIPDEVVPASGRQLGFWGGRAERADDVTRAVARIQGLLGPEAVSVPEWRGGRGPAEQITLLPAAAVDLGEERVATSRQWISEPWPGRIPLPSPARVPTDPVPVEVLDVAGVGVGVTGRGELTSSPSIVSRHASSSDRSTLAGSGDRRRIVQEWAGPWPVEERWWDVMTHRRRARMQVVFDDGSAHLLVIEDGSWWLEATYH